MRELLVSRRELQVLTNSFHSGDARYLHVSYPFYDLELFTLDIQKPELTGIVPPKDFEWARNSRKPTERGFSADELPSYTDLRNCLLSSGFLSYRNEREVAEKLLHLREEARDPNERPRPLFVAADTNILYFMFLSRRFPMEAMPGRRVEASDFRYVVSEIVQREIDSRIVHKYSREEIQALSATLAHPELLREFANGSGRRERCAKLAFNEMTYVLTELRALRIKGSPPANHGENDIAIAQAYKAWARSGDYEVFLLTGDEDMVNHARTSELMTMQLEMPFDFPSHARIDPWRMTDLLYDLTLTFGALSLGPGCTMLGEWGGKSSKDYLEERVKVRLNDDRAADAISRDLALCRRILSEEGRT